MTDKDAHADDGITRYEGPGIEERHGKIPTWLMIVYIAMSLWMVWYTIKFWTDKG